VFAARLLRVVTRVLLAVILRVVITILLEIDFVQNSPYKLRLRTVQLVHGRPSPRAGSYVRAHHEHHPVRPLRDDCRVDHRHHGRRVDDHPLEMLPQ